jgi:hypothetical protein
LRTPLPKTLSNKLQRGRIFPAHPQWIRTVAMLCMLLMSAVGTVQAVHIHGDWLPQNAAHVSLPADGSQGQGEEHCPLCVAMHSTLPVTMVVAPAPLLEAAQPLSTRVLIAPQKLWSFAMFSRPPPVAAMALALHEGSTDSLRGVAAAG